MPDTMADRRRIEMGQATDVPLILGGHSFINQLGNDPSVSEQDRYRIVESCLEHGIRWFDTTYQPERVALGKVFQAIGRRNEATILAWNFFTDFSPDDQPTGPEYYRPHHINIILEQLRTDHVDCLVAIPLNDAEQNQRQVELLIEAHLKEPQEYVDANPDKLFLKMFKHCPNDCFISAHGILSKKTSCLSCLSCFSNRNSN